MNWIIGDIHGCFELFRKLCEKIDKVDKEATIILVGDIIDRGPDTIKMIEWAMENVDNNGGKYQMVMGNHEELAIEWFDNEYLPWYEADYGIGPPRSSFDFSDAVYRQEWDKDQIESVINFFKSLPLYRIVNTETRKYVIAHAWAPCEARLKEIIDGRSISEVEKSIFLWDRREGEEYDSKEYWLVHGHTPTINKFDRCVGTARHYENVINMDCGANWPIYGGRLGAICLETMEEIYVK